jgi:hypothetical protein
MCDNLSHQQLGRKLRVLTRHVIVISFGLSRVDPDRLESKAKKKNCSIVGPLRIKSIPSSHHHPVKDTRKHPVNCRIPKGAGLVRVIVIVIVVLPTITTPLVVRRHRLFSSWW